MLDFNTLTPEDLELLAEELLRGLGFTIESRPARGPDKGKDLLATRHHTDLMRNVEEERYLVECKHFSKSGRSVQEADIGNFQAKLSLHRANRYLLITTTLPSETVRDHFTAVSCDPTNPYKAGFWARNDLNLFLDERPSLRARYFPDNPPLPSAAQFLAADFGFWMAASGFSLVSSVPTIPPGGAAALFRSPEGKNVLALYIVGEGNISALEKAVDLGRHASADEAWLVAPTRIAPSAQLRAAELKNAKAVTVTDFIHSIMEVYRAAISGMINWTGMSEHYVELGFEKPTFRSDGTEVARDSYASVTSYFEAWCSEPASTHVILLGDYGSGKTWASLRYVSMQLDSFWDNPLDRRLPIYIPLRQIDRNAPVLEEIARIVSTHYGLRGLATASAVADLNSSGKLLLVLDGFDEFTRLEGDEQIVQSIKTLGSLITPRSKVLLTSRGHFFKSFWHVQDLFVRALGSADNSPSFEVMNLSADLAGLDRQRIAEILKRRLRSEADDVMRVIESTYDLMDLARRPLLLDMMIKTLTDTGRIATTPFQLFDTYTRAWLDRDRWRGALLSVDRSYFAEELAWYLFVLDRVEISLAELNGLLKKRFDTKAGVSLDAIASDIRTSSFLVRDVRGSYSFAHKSFMEFFVAKWIVRTLAAGSLDCLDRVSGNPGPVFASEVDNFLGGADVPSSAIEFLNSVVRRGRKRAGAAKRVLELLGH